jgi:predicted nucleic acid-binding protein
MTSGGRRIPKYYWDACVFLSGIEETLDRRPIIENILEDCENGNVEIYTSLLTVCEVAFAKAEKDRKVLDPDIERKIDRLWSPPSPVKLVEIDQLTVLDARDLIRETVPYECILKPPDAIHLVSAKRMGVTEFHTYDDKLGKFSEMMGYRIRKPHTDKFVFLAEDAEDRDIRFSSGENQGEMNEQ